MAGQAVTWLVPHQLSQVLPGDVDYRVMLTFLEFYSTLVQVRRGPGGCLLARLLVVTVCSSA